MMTTKTKPKITKRRARDFFDLILIGATHGLSDGYAGMLKPILILIVLDLGLTKFQAGKLLSIFSITSFLFIYPLSLLADTSGRKKEILITGLSLASAAYFAMRWAPSFALISLCVFLAGAGNATFHPSGTSLTTERFPKSRSYAVSVYSMMGNAGASLMPVAQAAIAAAFGWRSSVSMLVLPALVLLPLVGFRYRNAPVKKKPGSKDHSFIGLARREISTLTRKVLKNRDVVILASVYALTGMATGIVSGFLSLLAYERFGLTTAAIGLAVSIYYLAGVFAKPLMGFLYDRWGARTALQTPLILAGLFTLAIALTPWAKSFIPLIILLGASIPISPIILTAAADRSDPAVMASSIGVIYTCYGLSFVSTYFGGWIAEQYNLVWSYALAGFMLWVGAGAALLLPKKLRKG